MQQREMSIFRQLHTLVGQPELEDTTTDDVHVLTGLEGRAALVLVNKAFVIAQGGRLRSHSVPREHRSGVVVIDVADQSGSMIVFNYRSPLTCEAR